ncbi:MAG: hypothetical protein V1740_03190 [Candidatus Woesearchaeota archaeon]
MQWYRVNGYRGHVGTGSSYDVSFFLRAKDIVDAFNRYYHVPSIKKSRIRSSRFHHTGRFLILNPSIFPLSGSESERLEEMILRDAGEHFKGWYYFPSADYATLTQRLHSSASVRQSRTA